MGADEIKWFPLDRVSDLERAIAEAVEDPKTRVYGLACALGLHGLRVSEVTRSLAGQFSPLNRTLHVAPWNEKAQECRPLKHGIARTVRLDPSVVTSIVNWRATRPDSRWLFPTRSGGDFKSQAFSSFGREMLIRLGCTDHPSTRFHMLRHTCAMRILGETNDLTLVQKHLGHRNIKTTMIYLECRKQVPDSCLVKLFDSSEKMPVNEAAQLQLFHPYDTQESG